MTKSENQDLISLYHLYGKLDQIEGNLMGSLPLGQAYHPKIKSVLSDIQVKAQRIAKMAVGLRDYK